MTNIFIDPSKSEISVQVKSQSLHALGFEITVFDSDRKTVIEQFTGDTKTNNPFIKKLEKNPADYKDKYIRGTFTVTSPDGKDYTYSFLFSISEVNTIIKPEIPLSGTTSGGTDTTGSTYHIQ